MHLFSRGKVRKQKSLCHVPVAQQARWYSWNSGLRYLAPKGVHALSLYAIIEYEKRKLKLLQGALNSQFGKE